VPARLRSSSSVEYPEAARSARVEADIPVEIVVDTSGAVISARALSSRGFGLERASVEAVRGYRFSPARRGGVPVRVRMRSTVSFRLRE
jgi:protein TonB